MVDITIGIWFLVLHVVSIFSMNCEYSSREFQVAIRPEILKDSFKNGITQILDELTKIERDPEVDFKVSLSSLKFKNVSVTEYILPSTRDVTDSYIPLRFKSRQKKPNEPADIVMKTSNADPELACLSLNIAEKYADLIKTKFELDIYAENGRVISKTAESYTIDLPLGFNQTSSINISKYLLNAATKLTHSGQSIVVIPDSLGTVTMETAEFDIRLLGEKFEATVFLLERTQGLHSEFSFKVKDNDVNWDVLIASQNLIVRMSQIPSIARFSA